jgi:hypothetical protein
MAETLAGTGRRVGTASLVSTTFPQTVLTQTVLTQTELNLTEQAG